jgi:hypothetical protein
MTAGTARPRAETAASSRRFCFQYINFYRACKPFVFLISLLALAVF